ncbi:MAG: PD40 domain-containing protein, partial [candidate division Zixibacteria bacterium]|nr:PD40 domain-containing protein [candidate division Zixibacteria bacterium]
TRFSFDAEADEWLPTWSPDGSRIAYSWGRESFLDIYLKPSTGAGAEEPLLVSNFFNRVTDWSADGRYIMFRHRDSAQSQDDAWVSPINTEISGATRQPRSFESTRFDEDCGTFSPDSRWIAYSSDESGTYEIYVKPFPGPGGKWQVSTRSGSYPTWRRDGRELYFITDNRMLFPVTASALS